MSKVIKLIQEPQKTIYTAIFNCKNREEKKALLMELSNTAKLKIELEQTECIKVNDVLIEMYTNQKHQEFNTFKNWKEKGFKVKKGSKGFFIWSKPLKGKKQAENKQTKKTEEKEYKFFGMAYLFSNEQVEPLN